MLIFFLFSIEEKTITLLLSDLLKIFKHFYLYWPQNCFQATVGTSWKATLSLIRCIQPERDKAIHPAMFCRLENESCLMSQLLFGPCTTVGDTLIISYWGAPWLTLCFRSQIWEREKSKWLDCRFGWLCKAYFQSFLPFYLHVFPFRSRDNKVSSLHILFHQLLDRLIQRPQTGSHAEV